MIDLPGRRGPRDLMNSGRSVETPAAVIRWGAYNGQQTVTGTLGSIAVDWHDISAGFEAASPEAVLRWAIEEFGPDVALSGAVEGDGYF